jgi:hypothetical protein
VSAQGKIVPGPYGKVDTSYYPDLVEHNGLVAALAALAQLENVDPGDISIQYSAKFAGYTSAAIETGRGRVLINLAIGRRLFLVTISGDRVEIASGATTELLEVLKVAAVWKSEASLDELSRKFPFIKITGLARVLSSSDPISSQWYRLLNSAEFEVDRELISAAYENPQIRLRFPDMSHRSIRLSRAFRDPEDVVQISLARGGGTVYQQLMAVRNKPSMVHFLPQLVLLRR